MGAKSRAKRRHERVRRNVMFALAGALAGSLFTWMVMRGPNAGAGPCAGRGKSLVVDLRTSDLFQCKADRVVNQHRIAYGSGGANKRKQGDKKTPVGAYRLGKPRASWKFGTFIPVGYPTRAQKKKGFTGSAIGIHGPDRRFTWAGPLNTVWDWTLGCVAVQSDAVIEDIADWVRAERVRVVHIEEADAANWRG